MRHAELAVKSSRLQDESGSFPGLICKVDLLPYTFWKLELTKVIDISSLSLFFQVLPYNKTQTLHFQIEELA